MSDGDSEARFETILEHAPVMIDAFAPDGSVVIWNRECERRLGWTAEEVAAMENPLLVFYPDPAERERVIEAIQRADGEFREYHVLAKDGGVRVQQWADFELPNGSRISVGHDVTEQRRTEATLRQAQKIQALGTFSGGIAHDFNNLLTIISCSATLSLRDLERDPETAERSLREIVAAAERGADLVRRLMSLTRRGGLRRRPLVFDETLSDFLPTLRRLVPESLELDVSLEAPAAVVLADPVAVEQIVINLLTNARDAIDGNGSISLRTNLETTEGGQRVVVEVADSGHGMDPETHERVFEPFFTTKAPGRGTGLGLPMVYGLVHQHDGEISIRSEPGRGTTVTIELPVSHDAMPLDLDAETPREGKGRGETILVVEDDRGVATTTARCLRRAGYAVLLAANGDEALEHLASHPEIALVLSDVVMPTMDGRGLRRRMRESQHEGVPLAFMSGYSAAVDDEVPVLPKPWSPDELARFVRRCLDELS